MRKHQAALRIAETVLLLLAPVYAQNGVVRATIPFEFTADQQAFAAGKYCIASDGLATVRFTRFDSSHTAEVITVPIRGAPQTTPRIVFHSYGERYFLAEIWLGESNMGRQVYASAAEVAMARVRKQEVTTIIATTTATK